ncbi:extracellular elastinolytic metalloproteinase [Chryseobacterium sp. SLBN-27]|uniref:T9SS-dependent M36 family metallopeptidase n=1 Tax=Chryseobacterium sp. SLBN-27 TaxID=3042287 RepID=UPI00285666FD|nr:T9SS-dependent M36 family metallopeptidase [Chryseobacterium sp. SLBN-27]MDR6158089.1 extracellular elastinolytic metalloproteinase [Chryseobacterium sp. SLBN-27]
MKNVALPLLFAVSLILPSALSGQEHQRLIKDYISQNKLKEYKKSDLSDFIIDVSDHSESMDSDIIKIQQIYKGIPVYRSLASVLIKNYRVAYYDDSFEKDYDRADSDVPGISKEAAFALASKGTNISDPSKVRILNFRDADSNDAFAKYQLAYVKKDQELILCYEFTFPERKTANYWDILVNANTGEIVEKNNLNLSCNFIDHPYGHTHESQLAVFPLTKENYPQQTTYASLLLAPDNASYNVFPFPIEAPTFGSRAIVTNPWILASSPEGWHSDGTNHYTTAEGNNVLAYQDLYDDDFFTGITSDGGSSRNFNFPYTPGALALTNQDAAITNLFYANNMVHDIFYKFGFTSAARNFQKNNFSLGGAANDYVMAEAQDGGATPVDTSVNPPISNYNNANFATPQDGGSGRMQMYLWVNSSQRLFYNAPATAINRTPISYLAQFGQQISGFPVTANVKLSPVLDACTALPTGSLSGFFGLAERGTCDFATKAENMQNAGAVGAIIYNAATSPAPGNMGGINPNVSIMSQLIDNAEGEYIKSQLAANIPVNVSMSYSTKQDGSFDNGIMIHEYGHGISNRLTGNGYSCLQTSQSREQMGEGWSDFFALMLTNKPGDNASVPRGMGTYASGEGVAGDGIRPAKYSPDFTINNYTYGDTNGMAFSNGAIDVHSIGFVWATMLWDLHWQYVSKYGYSSDVTANTTNGSSRVLQLVTNALKVQVCNPTFINGRDALLTAELALTQGADRCMIWRTFAKRGLGVNASAGSKTNINDQVEDFTTPGDCILATDEVNAANNTISIYPNPAKNEFFINFPPKILGKVSVEIYDMSGKLVSSEDKISPDAKRSISTDKLVNGTYVVKVKGIGIDTTSKLIVKK